MSYSFSKILFHAKAIRVDPAIGGDWGSHAFSFMGAG
jgi:hypothetical protein